MKFDLKIFIYQRPDLRCGNAQTEAFMGMNIYTRLFDEMQIDGSIRNVYLPFPERWLNVVEQRQLLKRIEEYFPNIESVEIKTHSVFIIQCASSEYQKIVLDPSGAPLIDELEHGKLYVKNAC